MPEGGLSPLPAGADTIARKGGEALRSERDRFVALAFTWGEILFELDEAGTVAFAAGLTGSILGREPEDLAGRRIADLVAPNDRHQLAAALEKARDRGRIGPATIAMAHEDGSERPLEISGYCLTDPPPRFFLALRARPAAPPPPERTEADGLYTPSAFAELASRRLGEDGGRQTKRMSLIAVPGMGDLAAKVDAGRGQELLGLVGQVLRGHADGGDAAARIADGKYGLLHAADLDLAGLRDELADLVRDCSIAGPGGDIGTATIAADAGLSEEDVTKGLLYAINSFQRSPRVQFTLEHLNRNLGSLVREATADVGKMKRVIRESHFDLAFQPIVGIADGELHHFEVLARFRGRYGASPYRYIAFAEETGLIVGFDLAVVRKTLDWLAANPRMPVPVAINVSGQSITDPHFCDAFLDLLRQNPSAGRRLMVEMTESSKVEDLGTANRFIQDIRRAGCPVCLDDFGAGAASFHYLTMLDVDIVKLDGPALHHCLTAPKGEAILSALVRMCEKVGIECVAEMVDGPEVLAFARRCGFVYAQGYFFGKPATDVAGFIRPTAPAE